MEGYSLVFINKMGTNIDGFNIYEFLFSNEPETVWCENWNVKSAGVCGKIPPDESTYDKVKVLQTNIVLDVAQENMCFSMQDCIDQIIALGYENLDNPDLPYPEDGRLVFKFGENVKDVEFKLAKRGMIMSFN